MKILQIRAQGFRSLKDINWEPGDLNVIIGANGSGKSNVLRLLELISVSAQGKLGKYVQAAGGIEPLLWDGSASRIVFDLKTSPPTPFGIPAPPVLETRAVGGPSVASSVKPATGDSSKPSVPLKPNIETVSTSTSNSLKQEFNYEVQFGRLGVSSAYRIDRELLTSAPSTGDCHQEGSFKLLERDGMRAQIFDEKRQEFTAQEESISEDETLLSLSAGPFIQNRLIPPYRRNLAGWTVYHDLRVDTNASIRQAVVSKVERRVTPDAQNLINVLHTLYTGDRDFKKDINAAMRTAFGSDFEELTFPPAADQRVQLRVRWKSLQTERAAADLSDGTLRFLFLLTVLATPMAPPVIAIDEPETGLHPSMMPIIAEFATAAADRSQVIFTTHSPTFLDAFRDVIPTTTIATWENGQTSLTVKSGDDLKRWLESYSLGALLESGDLEALA